MRKYVPHVNDPRYIPLADWSMRAVGAITFWGQFGTFDNATFELQFGVRREHCSRRAMIQKLEEFEQNSESATVILYALLLG